jgi:RNA polymerase sigma factor FliA
MDARHNFDTATATRCPDPGQWSNELVRTHDRLVHKIARQVFSRVSSAIAMEDLVQIGQIALIMAARTFVDRGTAAFSTYATVRVRGAMIDELRRSATMSREALRRRRGFEKARQELHGTLGRVPNDGEMASHVNMAVGAYRSAINSMQSIEYRSIDEEYSDSSAWFADLSPGVDEVMDVERRRTAISASIAKLPEREQVVLQLYFVDECSLEEIGKIFNVGAARVCQIKANALKSLRSGLGQWQDD